MHWQEQGKTPDYRFSLANERTFLAWIRTALAVLAGGILLHQFLQSLQGNNRPNRHHYSHFDHRHKYLKLDQV